MLRFGFQKRKINKAKRYTQLMGFLNKLFKGINKTRIDQEIDRLSDTLSKNPYDFHSYEKRGRLKSEKNDWHGAIADFTVSISLNVQDPCFLDKNSKKEDYECAINSYYNRAQALEQLGDIEAAMSDYREVLRLFPEDTVTLKRIKKLQDIIESRG